MPFGCYMLQLATGTGIIDMLEFCWIEVAVSGDDHHV